MIRSSGGMKVSPFAVAVLGALLSIASASCTTQDDSAQSRRRDIVGDLREDVIRLLRSGDTVRVAQGAHRAGLHRLSEAVPDLLRVLRQYRSDSSTPGRLVRLLATDALVQLGAQLSTAQARVLDTEDMVIPSLVLLSQNPKRHLRQLREIHDANETGKARQVWQVTGNLLAQEKAAGFAAKLMGAFQMKLKISVLLPNQVSWNLPVVVGSGGASGAHSSGPSPRGFPRLPFYSLTSLPCLGDIVLAPGKDPIYYRRTLMEEGMFEQDLSEDSFRSDLTRLGWIETMAGTRAEVLGFKLESWHEIQFKSEKSYSEAVRESHSALERAWRSFVQCLEATGALTREEAARLPPKIHLVIDDERDPFPGDLPSWKDDR
jgi:hypothetical protein